VMKNGSCITSQPLWLWIGDLQTQEAQATDVRQNAEAVGGERAGLHQVARSRAGEENRLENLKRTCHFHDLHHVVSLSACSRRVHLERSASSKPDKHRVHHRRVARIRNAPWGRRSAGRTGSKPLNQTDLPAESRGSCSRTRSHCRRRNRSRSHHPGAHRSAERPSTPTP